MSNFTISPYIPALNENSSLRFKLSGYLPNGLFFDVCYFTREEAETKRTSLDQLEPDVTVHHYGRHTTVRLISKRAKCFARIFATTAQQAANQSSYARDWSTTRELRTLRRAGLIIVVDTEVYRG